MVKYFWTYWVLSLNSHKPCNGTGIPLSQYHVRKIQTNWPSIMSVAESALSGICTNIPSKLKISRMLFQVCKDITVKLLLIFKQFHILFKKVLNDQMHATLAGDINFHIFDISPLLNIFDVVYHTYTKNSTLYRNTSEIQKFSIM